MRDEDRVIKDAVEEFERRRSELKALEATNKLPQPGQHHNASSIPVSDVALASLLSEARIAEVLLPCPVEDCEMCNEHRLIWWDCCNALDRSTRIALQAWLVAKGYGLPDAPWEDLNPDATAGPIIEVRQ